MKDILIVGSGGFAKEVFFLIEEINKIQKCWNILGYVSNDFSSKREGELVYLTDDELVNYRDRVSIVFGIGNPSLINTLWGKYSSNPNISFPNIIHPNVIGDFRNIKMGIGNVICASNIFTTNIILGSFNIINLACTIGHDVTIGSFNIVNPSVNISGGVILNDEILIGTGTQILQYKEIKSNIIVGAGSVVTKSIMEPGIYAGIPAAKLNKK